MRGLKRILRKMPLSLQNGLRQARGGTNRTLRPVDWGNLRRAEPFSERYGYERGVPIDRWYVDQFIRRHSVDIAGRVLELLDGRYAKEFGGTAIRSLDILDIDSRNPDATIVADLGQDGSLPAGHYDCFVLTQTLYLIRDLDTAIQNAWRCLAKGGVLLITVPTLVPLDPIHGPDADYWRFTPAGLRQLLRSNTSSEPEITSYGNLLTCMGTMLGLAAQDLAPDELTVHDSRYPVLTCARLVRMG